MDSGDGTIPPNGWLRREFQRAKERTASLPKHARPVVVRRSSTAKDSTETKIHGPTGGETVTDSVDLRRAIFVYEAARIQAEAMLAPIVPEPWDQRDEAFQDQFVDVVAMMCGPDRKTSPEELHDDWVKAYEKMGWRYGPVRDVEAKTHPDLVPFEELGDLEQSKDAIFITLTEIARKWIPE